MVKKQSFVYDVETFPNLFLVCARDIHSGDKKKFVIFQDPRDKKIFHNDLKALISFFETNVQVVVGYNNHEYDDIMVKYLMVNKKSVMSQTPIKITAQMKQLNDRIINKDRHHNNADQIVRKLKYNYLFNSLDLLELFNTVDRTSLKQLAVNIRWHNIIDLPFSPDHVVISDELEDIIYYCFNDVDITKEVLKIKEPEIRFRKKLSILYGLNLINNNDTDMAKAIISKFYSEGTGIPFENYKDKKTHYKTIELKTCVSPKIKFITLHYQKLLNIIRAKKVKPFRDKDDEKQFEEIFTTRYMNHTIGLGGIHSRNTPEEFIADDEYEYIDADVTFFYPRLICNEKLFPKHMGPEFTQIYEEKVVNMRLETKKLWKAGIDAENNKTVDEGLKKTGNGTFGLTKSIYSWLYDPHMATYICVSGQLFLLMLIERLELFTDTTVIYSNTDGFICKVRKDQKEDYMRICRQWMEVCGFTLEFVNYDHLVIKDISNYLMIPTDKEVPIKQKGIFLTKKPITMGYKFPVVPKAIYDFYTKGTPLESYLKNEKDLFEFMRSERTNSKKFDVYYYDKDGSYNNIQKTNRWVVTSKNPNEVKLLKQSKHRKNKIGEPMRQAMQKNRHVILLNDMNNSPAITDVKIDYNFYLTECLKILRPIKKHSIVREMKNVKQGHLF